MKIRTNIYLEDYQEEGIAKIIEINKLGTKAQIVRNAIDEYLNKHNIEKNIVKREN